jgi:hypothetical protein
MSCYMNERKTIRKETKRTSRVVLRPISEVWAHKQADNLFLLSPFLQEREQQFPSDYHDSNL